MTHQIDADERKGGMMANETLRTDSDRPARNAGQGGAAEMPESIADILNEKYWEDGDDAHWYDVTGGEGDAFLRVSFEPLCMTLAETTFGMRPMEKEAVLRAADMIRRIEAALSAGDGTEGER